ncbi:MAG: hypothetical protein GX596_00555 [Propionibacterium sp.]|nr:hypothetical protein [Propionibacterium sp.]
MWYESQSPGIGLTLLDRAEEARRAIEEWPWSAPRLTDEVDSSIHSKAVRGYPYRLLYAITDEEFLILAYAHDRRRPGYWVDRMDGLTSP